jgi:hypothetical protein
MCAPLVVVNTSSIEARYQMERFSGGRGSRAQWLAGRWLHARPAALHSGHRSRANMSLTTCIEARLLANGQALLQKERILHSQKLQLRLQYREGVFSTLAALTVCFFSR